MFDQIFGLLFQPFQQFQFLHLLVCCWPPPPLCKNNISTGFNTFSNFSLKLICHLSYFQRQLLVDNRYLILIDHPKKYTCFSLHNFFRLNSLNELLVGSLFPYWFLWELMRFLWDLSRMSRQKMRDECFLLLLSIPHKYWH